MKKVWVYVVIIVIIVATIIGMIFLSNNVNLSFNNAKIINKIINQKASKINENYPWVYDYKSSNKEVIIPYFNIDSKNIKDINIDNINANYDNVIHANYVYSVNDDVLSLLYTKEYANKIDYQVYNISLNTSKVMNTQDVLDYYSLRYDNILEKALLSAEFYLKQLNYSEDLLATYIDDTNNSIRENGFEIYIGSNHELYIIVNIVHERIEKILIPIIDK